MLSTRVHAATAAVLGALVLGACGSSSSTGAETTPAPQTTPWRTLPPVADTAPGDGVEIEGGVVNYKVKSGDYPNGIAKKAGGGCSGTELLDFNPDIKILVPGINMRIPASCLAAGVTEETLNAEDDPAPDATDPEKTTTTVPGYNEYTVVSGDYPFGIVEKTGCSYNELKKANPGKLSRLRPKMTLKIPVSCDTRDLDSDAKED